MMIRRTALLSLIGIAVAAISVSMPRSQPLQAEPLVDTSLYAGWNAFVYFGDAQPVEDALAPIAGKYDQVCILKGEQQDWDCNDPNAPPVLNELQQLERYSSYLIAMD